MTENELDEKKVKRLVGMMNEMTAVKIPPMKPIVRCFKLGMDEDILEYLLRVGTSGHSKETLEQLFHTMRAMGEISGKRDWRHFWDEIMVMSFLVPQENNDGYELASIFPGWIELATSGAPTPKRQAIMESFMEFWQILKTTNVAPLRFLTDMQGLRDRDHGVMHMGTPTAVTPARAKRPAAAPESTTSGAAAVKTKRTIAVDEPLESEQEVLTMGTVFEIFARHKDDIAVMNCICRSHKQLNGGGTCEHGMPLQSCMPVGAIARQLIDSGVARHVPYEEALDMVRDFERKGCIHTTFHYAGDANHEVMAVCNCCTECCLLYGGLRQGFTSKVQMKAFNKPEVVDAAACIGCNRCGKHCPTGAISYNRGRGKLEFDYEKCVGCGQCVTQCPRGVQRMVPDERAVFVKSRKPSECDEQSIPDMSRKLWERTHA